ncbi:MAG: reverse transcriptase domain-containing protein [Gammaproteobacteria bacterium]
MPRRQWISLNDVALWDNVCRAAYQAARGKRSRPDVKAFFTDFSQTIPRVQYAIRSARLVDGVYRSFIIRDPKVREIHAVSFPDRVLHHALINCIGGRMERSWVDSSYACRTGKGAHRAIIKAQHYCQHYPFVIKMDVSSYFSTVNHAILMRLLHRIFKGEHFFTLLENILSSFSSEVGLPIGALTSQYFANHYLDGFQRFLKQQKGVCAELRYMDDCLVWVRDQCTARQVVKRAEEWLVVQRAISLKPSIIQRTRIGLSFCGFKINHDGIWMGKRRKRRYRHFLKTALKAAQYGGVTHLSLQAQTACLRSLCLPGDHGAWQRGVWEGLTDVLRQIEV